MLGPLARDDTPIDAAWLVLSEVANDGEILIMIHLVLREIPASTVTHQIVRTRQKC